MTLGDEFRSLIDIVCKLQIMLVVSCKLTKFVMRVINFPLLGFSKCTRVEG